MKGIVHFIEEELLNNNICLVGAAGKGGTFWNRYENFCKF